jgi:hypothetical protein
MEMMVVISIFTLLLSISLPSLAKGKRSARAAICASNARQITIAHDAYTINNKGSLLPYEIAKIYMPQLLPFHAGDKDIRFCPEATTRHPDGGGWGSAVHAWGFGIYDGSYALNGFLYRAYGGDVGNEGGRAYFAPAYSWPAMWFGNTLESVSKTSHTPIFADSPWVDAWPTGTDGKPADYGGRIAANYGFQMHRIAIDRHDMTVNVAFADESARRFQLKELWTLNWHRNYLPPNPAMQIP